MRKSHIYSLIPGDILGIKDEGLTNNAGYIILKFSKKFNEIISQFKDQGYHLQKVRINFIVYWKDSDKEKESKIILPELDFEK